MKIRLNYSCTGKITLNDKLKVQFDLLLRELHNRPMYNLFNLTEEQLDQMYHSTTTYYSESNNKESLINPSNKDKLTPKIS